MLKELTVVVGGQIYAPEILDQKNIFIEGGKIKKISTDKPPNHAKIINADGLLVIPGLIDALVHGGGGRHTMTGDPEDVAHIARTHAKHGVTSVLMATSSAKIEEIEVSLAAIAHIVDNPIKNGANVLGSYVEGKFGCLEKCGAQNPDTMSPPNFEELHRMWEHSDGTLKVISIAPERDPDLVFTKHLSEQSAENYNDIVVALGHTNASYDLAKSAIDNGALGSGIAGSGPSVYAMVKGEKKAKKVGEAMSEILIKIGLEFNLHVSEINRNGIKVLSKK